MNSFFRNVKTLKIPAIKCISNKVTPSLSSIENIRRNIPINEPNTNSQRSRSLPPVLSPFKPFDAIYSFNFNSQTRTVDTTKFQGAKATRVLNKPTFKVLCKFRRNFSQRSFGRNKNKGLHNKEQLDKKKKRGYRDRVCERPCIKPENDTVKRKNKPGFDKLPTQGVKMVHSNRSFHLLQTSSTANDAFRNPYNKKSMSTSKNVTEINKTKLRTIIDLNEKVKANKFRNTIVASKQKDKVTFHYLVSEQECKQCVSKNQRRLSDFYQKNSAMMGKFSNKKRYYSSYYAAPMEDNSEGNAQDKEKEVVYVKDQSLNSGFYEKSVTLFNLIKLQSNKKDYFTPTNKYKFEPKKRPDEYKFPEDQRRNNIDPYPLEMFEDDYINLQLESARNMRKNKAYQKISEREYTCKQHKASSSDKDRFIKEVEDTRETISMGPCGCDRTRPTKRKEPKNDSYANIKHKPQKPDKRTPNKKAAEGDKNHNCLQMKNLFNLEYDLKKCPDCGTNIKKDRCKIKVPKKKEEEENERCRKPKEKGRPCKYRHPCDHQKYRGLNPSCSTPYSELKTSLLAGQQEISNLSTIPYDRIDEDFIPLRKSEGSFANKIKNMLSFGETSITSSPGLQEISNVEEKTVPCDRADKGLNLLRKLDGYHRKKNPGVGKISTIEFQPGQRPVYETGKKQEYCQIEVPKKDEHCDYFTSCGNYKDSCQKRGLCKQPTNRNSDKELENRFLNELEFSQRGCQELSKVNNKLQKSPNCETDQKFQNYKLQVSKKKQGAMDAFNKPEQIGSSKTKDSCDLSFGDLASNRRNSWPEINKKPKKVYFDEYYNGDSHINERTVNLSPISNMYKLKNHKSEDKLQENRYLEKQVEKIREEDPKGVYFIHPKDSLSNKISDSINNMSPKVEIGEESKQKLADAIKQVIQPVIEKEFLKYDEVKAALERMEKNLERTLGTLRIAKSSSTVESSKSHSMFSKYPWQSKKECEITELNENPEMKEPYRKKNEHRDPQRRTSVNSPPKKSTEIFQDPRAHLNINFHKFKSRYDPCVKTSPKNYYLKRKTGIFIEKPKIMACSRESCKNDNPCDVADNIFRKGKKTDPFSTFSKKAKDDSCKAESSCKKETACKKNDPWHKETPCNHEDPCKKDPCKMEDPCQRDDPCQKKDPCKKKDPYVGMSNTKDPCQKEASCKKLDPCKEEDPCKPDPCKKSCSRVKLPETICKIDPCNNTLCQQNEPPCSPCSPANPPCPESADLCDDRDPKGGVITCREPIICNKPCKPPVTCGTCSEFGLKESSCQNPTPKIKVHTPVCKVACDQVPQPESCPLKPLCTKKCPEVKSVDCLQKPCKVCKEPAEPSNVCMRKQPAAHCIEKCVERKVDHGITGMKEPIKCDFTANSPCPCCEGKPESHEVFIRISATPKPSETSIHEKESCPDVAQKEKAPCDPNMESSVPIVCKKDEKTGLKQVVCERDARYCDKNVLMKEEEEIMRLAQIEEVKRKQNEFSCVKRPVNFGEPPKCAPFKIENKKMGDAKTLPACKGASQASTNIQKPQEPKKSQSETAASYPGNSKKNNNDKSLVESCSEKISDLCMMIVRKHKGGKKAAPIVVTLSRSEPCMDDHDGFQGMVMAGAGGASGGGSSGGGRGRNMNCNPFGIFQKSGTNGGKYPWSKRDGSKKDKENESKTRSQSSCNEKKNLDNSAKQQKSEPCVPCKHEKYSKQGNNQDPCKKKQQPIKTNLCNTGKSSHEMEDIYNCVKKKGTKKDSSKKKEDSGKKTEDLCKKMADICKKKEDQSKKKEDLCKKNNDPCKIKQDPCKKTGSSGNTDMGASTHPCKKSKSEGAIIRCAKKDDPGKNKEDPCKKREDPCKKSKSIIKCKSAENLSGKHMSENEHSDPYNCVKKTKQSAKKDDPCKKKEDPSEKKEDPCKKKSAGTFDDCKPRVLKNCSKDSKDKCKDALNKPQKKNVGKYAARKSFKDKFPWKGGPCESKKKECLVTEVSKENCETKKAASEQCLVGQQSKSLHSKAKSDPCVTLKNDDPCRKRDKMLKKILKNDDCKNKPDSSKKKEDPCKKKEDLCKKEEDPCKKKEDPCKKKEDPSKKKQDPCKKKEDPCKKEEDPCKKKEDPCKKKEDPSKKKEDPCKKEEDPCKKKEDPCKKKEDPSKKKQDPCKKKDDHCKKKEDPYKKKEDPCKKKEDPCKKKEDLHKKKEDPCKKKEDPCKKKEDPCKKKEDPSKKKEDPCKKKEDPCKKKEDPSKKKEDPCKNQAKLGNKKENQFKTGDKPGSCGKLLKIPCEKKKYPTKKEDPAKKKENTCGKPLKKKCDGSLSSAIKCASASSDRPEKSSGLQGKEFKSRYPWNMHV